MTAAEKDGTRLIIVTLNGKDDVNTHMRLYEHFFPLLARVDLSGFTEGLSVPVTGGTRDSVAAGSRQPSRKRPCWNGNMTSSPGRWSCLSLSMHRCRPVRCWGRSVC